MTRVVTIAYKITARRREARKPHEPGCDLACPTIRPGEVYLEVVEFPGGTPGYATTAGKPVRTEPAHATATGRWHLRVVGPEGRKYGGGVPGAALCDRDLRPRLGPGPGGDRRPDPARNGCAQAAPRPPAPSSAKPPPTPKGPSSD